MHCCIVSYLVMLFPFTSLLFAPFFHLPRFYPSESQVSKIPAEWTSHPLWENRTVTQLGVRDFAAAQHPFLKTERNLLVASSAPIYREVFFIFFAIYAEKAVETVHDPMSTKSFCGSEDVEVTNEQPSSGIRRRRTGGSSQTDSTATAFSTSMLDETGAFFVGNPARNVTNFGYIVVNSENIFVGNIRPYKLTYELPYTVTCEFVESPLGKEISQCRVESQVLRISAPACVSPHDADVYLKGVECKVEFTDPRMVDNVAHVMVQVKCLLHSKYPSSDFKERWSCKKPGNPTCTEESPCGWMEGDCHVDRDCASGLKCGTSNCPLQSEHDPCQGHDPWDSEGTPRRRSPPPPPPPPSYTEDGRRRRDEGKNYNKGTDCCERIYANDQEWAQVVWQKFLVSADGTVQGIDSSHTPVCPCCVGGKSWFFDSEVVVAGARSSTQLLLPMLMLSVWRSFADLRGGHF